MSPPVDSTSITAALIPQLCVTVNPWSLRSLILACFYLDLFERRERFERCSGLDLLNDWNVLNGWNDWNLTGR